MGEITTRYVQGTSLIANADGSGQKYYFFNGHGDVVQLLSSTGALLWRYEYDAFGVEKTVEGQDPETDNNPFRYCGEYFDKETGTVYLRARYYAPTTGRFLSEDTHWNVNNMIYGDNPVKWNERKPDKNDPLGLNTYTYKPGIIAIMQSINLYSYCINNPLIYVDPSGNVVKSGTVTGAAAWKKIGIMALATGVNIGGVVATFFIISGLGSVSGGVLAGLIAATFFPEMALSAGNAVLGILQTITAIVYTIKYGGFSYTDYGLTGNDFVDFFAGTTIVSRKK